MKTISNFRFEISNPVFPSCLSCPSLLINPPAMRPALRRRGSARAVEIVAPEYARGDRAPRPPVFGERVKLCVCRARCKALDLMGGDL